MISYDSAPPNATRKTVEAQFLTVHKAKGLEADIVVVLNCNSGKYGFPSQMSDDPVLNLLLSKADQFENGEERRLFYVAMTRAKEKVYFIADSSHKSKFISELELQGGATTTKKCPRCESGDLAKEVGRRMGDRGHSMAVQTICTAANIKSGSTDPMLNLGVPFLAEPVPLNPIISQRQ